ncbi:hypothetical protein EC40522_5590, partial [Escherichia coli 4.0522]
MEPYTTQRDGELVTVTIKTAAATGTLNVLLRYTRGGILIKTFRPASCG